MWGDLSESVVVADDDVLLREGLVSLFLSAGMTVVGQAGSCDTLLQLVARHQPSLAVIDIRMPSETGLDGLAAAQRIREGWPGTAALVLSAHIEVEHAIDLLGAGDRSGYLLKDRVTDIEMFLASVRRVAAGGTVVDPEIVRELMMARRRHDTLAVLSDREREVLSLLAEGKSNSGIAEELWLAVGTVEKHVRSILTKLGIHESDGTHRRVLAVLRYLECV